MPGPEPHSDPATSQVRRAPARLGSMSALAALLFLCFAFSSRPGAEDSSPDSLASGNDLPVATSCPLDGADLGVPIVPLTAAWLDSVARGIALGNEAHLAQLDSLYRAGVWGEPGSDAARDKVQLLSRMTVRNCYAYLLHWASEQNCVYQANDSTLVDVFQRYSDPSLFSIARLRQVRLGLGRVCLHYDLSTKLESVTILGSKRLRYRIKDEKLSGTKRRVLSLELPTGADDTVEVLLAEHYSCAVDHSTGQGPPGPYEVYLVHDIQGGWLRKWGTHRPTAFMFWSTPQDSPSLEFPSVPLVGVRIYVPKLKFKLPFIIPDVNIDDLRTMELPEPLLEMSYLREHRYPDWIETDDSFNFRRWTGHGEVPSGIRAQFPDR